MERNKEIEVMNKLIPYLKNLAIEVDLTCEELRILVIDLMEMAGEQGEK